MTFFESGPDHEPEEERREPYRRSARIHGPSPDEVGRPIAASFVLGRSDRAAVLVQVIRVHSTGCLFEIEWILRRTTETAAEWDGFNGTIRGRPLRRGREEGSPLIGVAFTDGSVARVGDRFDWRDPGDAPRLVPTGGSSSGGGSERRHGEYQLWLTPLPPAPTMEIICAWPDHDIPETRSTIDAAAILDAAANAHWVWPDDADLPEETDE